jgi:hypothetical protein
MDTAVIPSPNYPILKVLLQYSLKTVHHFTKHKDWCPDKASRTTLV